jgi:hypothetical protein
VSEREVEDGRVRIRVKEKSKKIITGVSSTAKSLRRGRTKEGTGNKRRYSVFSLLPTMFSIS